MMLSLARLFKQKILVLIVFALGLIPLTWYKPNFIIATGDYFPIFFNSQEVLYRDVFLWDQRNLGEASLSPVYVVYEVTWFLLQKLGLPVGFIQILIYTFCFVGTGLGMYYFVTLLYPEMRFSAFIASVFYMFNVFVVVRGFQHRGIMFTYLFLPFLMALLVKIAKDIEHGKNPNKGVLIFAILSVPAFSFAAFNSPNIVLMFLALTSIALYYLVFKRYRMALARNLLKLMILTFLFNIWWIISIFNYALTPGTLSTEVSVLAWSWTHQRASFLNLFWLNPHWGWNPIYYPYAGAYSNPVLAVLVFVPTILGFSSLLFKNKKRLLNAYISAWILLFMFLAKGLHKPFSSINLFLYENIPMMSSLFRNPTLKFTLIAVPFLALLIGFSTGRILMHVKRRVLRIILVALFISLFLTTSFPLITGEIIRGETSLLPSSYVTFPEYWYDASEWLNAQYGDFKVLLMPINDFYQMPYTWGYYGADVFPSRLVSKSMLNAPFGYKVNPEISLLTSQFHQAVENNRTIEFQILLELTGVRYILLRNDIKYDYYKRKIMNPHVVRDFLEEQSNIKLAKRFGNLFIYEFNGLKPIMYVPNKVIAFHSFSINCIPTLSHVQGFNVSKFALIQPQHLWDELVKEEIYNVLTNEKGIKIDHSTSLLYDVEILNDGNYSLAIDFEGELRVLVDNESFIAKSSKAGLVYIGPINLHRGHHEIKISPIVSNSIQWSFDLEDHLREWREFTPEKQFGALQELLLENGTLKIELHNSTRGWKTINSPLINTSWGKECYFELKIKGQNVSHVHIKMVEYDLNKKFINASRVATVGGYENENFDWEKISFHYSPLENTSYIQLQIWHGKETNATLPNIIWIDEAEVLEYKSARLQAILFYHSSKNGTLDDIFISRNTPARVTKYRKISPTQYIVEINATEPFILAFVNAYDPLWIAYVNGERIKSIPLYSVINGFWINQTGQLEITIEYEPQKWFYYGSVISVTTFLACLTYLTYNWTKNKAIWKRTKKILARIRSTLPVNRRCMHLTAPQGVRGRNADLTLVRNKIGWQPKVSLEEGLEKTYEWIEQKVNEDRKAATYPA